MKKVKIFLASSDELKDEREKFEIEVYRKSKTWSDHGVLLHLDIWEDLTARMSVTSSQDKYNKKVKEADLFVLLAYSKVGMYTAEEFETAFGAFQSKQKPFVFTYFKEISTEAETSLQEFKNKLENLGHFYSPYKDFNDLWNQFNKELDRLLLADFNENEQVWKSTYVDNRNTTIKNQFNNSTLNNPVFNYGTKSIKKHLGNLPILPEIFLGRADDLHNIHDLLFSGDNLLLLVNGEGGIGKTTVASYYYATYVNEYKHLAMVFAENSIADAIISLAIYLELEFEQNAFEAEKINRILLALAELEKPCLLIIDNANNLDDLDKWYPSLRRCLKLHLLLTSRISWYENAASYPVNALNDNDAKLLFKKLYKKHDDSEENLLESILVAIGYNTLVIELLAKNLNNFNNVLRKNYPLSDLLDDIQKNGVLALTKSGNVKTDYKLKPAKPEEIVEAMYSIGELSETEKQLLSVLAVLPAEKIPFENIVKLLPSFTDLDELLLSLAQKGWIEFDEKLKSFKCSPVIQEIVRKHNKNSLTADCHELVDSLINLLYYEAGTGILLNVNHYDGAVFVRYAEMVCTWLIPLRADISILLDRLGSFFTNYGNLDKALKYFEERSRLGKELFESNNQNVGFKNGLAISFAKLGETHTALGNLDKALKFFQDYSRLEKELFESNSQNVGFKNDLAISYGKLGETHTTLGNLDKALKFFEEDLNLSKELFESNPQNVEFKNSLAITYSRLGSTHTALGNLDKALKFFEDYSRLEKELFESNPKNVGFKNGLAISYQNLGLTHTSLGNLDKALKYFEDFSRLEKELFELNPQNVGFKNGLAISYEKLGSTHTSLGNLDKALRFFEERSRLSKELFETNPQNVGFKNGLAVSYQFLGKTHTSLGNLDKALKYFEDYLRLEKELFESNTQNVKFKNGLAISYQNLGLSHTSLGNLDKALKYFEDFSELMQELFESNPQNVEFKNNLAISYEKLGSTHTTLGNLDKALKFFEDFSRLEKELFESNPKNVGFKNSLAISYSKLGDTHTSLGNLDKALKYFEDYSSLEKELFESNPQNVGFKNGLAISYQNLGLTHISLGNLDKALKYFENFSKLMIELFESNPQNVGFKNGLAVSYSKLGSTHTSIGNLDKALKYFENDLQLSKELFESNPQNVGFKNGLAVSYANLGLFYRDEKKDIKPAKEYFQNARQLWEALAHDFPDRVEFQNNLNLVSNVIVNLR